MSTYYTMIANNNEITAIHQNMIMNGGSLEDDQKELIDIFGGIDNILAYFLDNKGLNTQQLTKIKTILTQKKSLKAPSIEEMDNMLDEIENANNNTNKHSNHLEIDTCNHGQSQSPINIISTTDTGITQVMPDKEFENNPLSFNYPSAVNNCNILNNGHTVQINIDCNVNKCTLSIHGKTYILRQFHFHTPSEHTIDSKQYEMEMHLVHTNEENEIAVLGFIFTTQQKYEKPKLQLTKSRAHLILAKNDKSLIMSNGTYGSSLKVMQESEDETSDDMETDDEWDENDKNDKNNKNDKKIKKEKSNDFLAQFWHQLPDEKTEKDIPLEKALSFDYLFESSSNNFVKNIKTNEINIDMEIFEYKGSLTTPPYTEGVQWLVSKKTHYINNKQLNKLSACWNNENNARPVQKYFGRKVSLRSKSSLRVVT